MHTALDPHATPSNLLLVADAGARAVCTAQREDDDAIRDLLHSHRVTRRSF
jgi:hypothetical protein